MSEIFRPQVEFDYLLKDVLRQGWAFELVALTLGFTRELRSCLAALSWRNFVDHGEVYQEFDVCTLNRQTGLPVPVRELYETLGQHIRWHAGRAEPLREWQPSEVAVQRYATSTAGIGRHRDYLADYGLIAVFTIEGSGQIHVYPDRREGEATHRLETGPGSMMLLAGTGLLEDDSSRPTHSVEPAICIPRTSMAFRMPVGDKPG